MDTNLILALAVIVGAVLIVGAVATGCWFVVRHMDHMHRIQRRQAGLPEVPRDKRKRDELEPIPAGVRALIDPWQSAAVRLALTQDVRLLRERGVPWKEIKRRLEAEEKVG